MSKTKPSFVRKIVDLETLCRQRELAKRAGKTVVQCHGCFDIVHPGHIRYLQYAKQQGDFLVVSLTGDKHVGKGESRPYVPQELRAENLAALEFVDFVYINPDPTAAELLERLRPDAYIKGREYEGNQHPGFLKERHTVESYGGRVIFSSGDVIYSSSHLIDNYAQQIDLNHEKLQLFCKRYEITRRQIDDLLARITERRFLVIGDTVLDRYQYCDATDLAGDGPMMSLVPLDKRDFLGGAAIVAQHLANLGASVTLITSMGTDDATAAAIDNLESLGIRVLAMRNRKRLATKTRYVVDSQKLFLVDESPAMPTDSAQEKWLLEQVAAELEQTATSNTDTNPGSSDALNLVLYDAGLGVFTDPLSAQLQAYYRKYRQPQSTQPQPPAAHPLWGKLLGGTAGSRGRLSRMKDADLVITTERGLRSAMRDYEQGISSLAWRFLCDNTDRALMLPSGKKGVITFDARTDATPGASWEGLLRSEYLAWPSSTVVDRLGFDEALLGIAAAMLGAGANIQQAMYVALAGAMLESQQSGHHAIDGQQLKQTLAAREELG